MRIFCRFSHLKKNVFDNVVSIILTSVLLNDRARLGYRYFEQLAPDCNLMYLPNLNILLHLFDFGAVARSALCPLRMNAVPSSTLTSSPAHTSMETSSH